MTDEQAKIVDNFARKFASASLLYLYHGVGFIVSGRLYHGERDMPTIVLQGVAELDPDWAKHATVLPPAKTTRIELQRYRIEVPHQRAEISAYVQPGHRDAIEMLLGAWSRSLTNEDYRAQK